MPDIKLLLLSGEVEKVRLSQILTQYGYDCICAVDTRDLEARIKLFPSIKLVVFGPDIGSDISELQKIMLGISVRHPHVHVFTEISYLDDCFDKYYGCYNKGCEGDLLDVLHLCVTYHY